MLCYMDFAICRGGVVYISPRRGNTDIKTNHQITNQQTSLYIKPPITIMDKSTNNLFSRNLQAS